MKKRGRLYEFMYGDMPHWVKKPDRVCLSDLGGLCMMALVVGMTYLLGFIAYCFAWLLIFATYQRFVASEWDGVVRTDGVMMAFVVLSYVVILLTSKRIKRAAESIMFRVGS